MQRHFHVLIHLSVSLIDIEYLDTSLWIDLTSGITRRSACFSVEIERLKKYCLLTITPNPNITLTSPLPSGSADGPQSEGEPSEQSARSFGRMQFEKFTLAKHRL
jgi:hypothetical protein